MPGPIRRLTCVALGVLILGRPAAAEDGYELWLRYPIVTNAALLAQYRGAVTGLLVAGESATARAGRDELTRGLRGLLGIDVPLVREATRDGVVVTGTPASSPIVAAAIPREELTHFDRTASGSNAVAQYAPPLRDAWGRLDRVPDDYLLWFDHVPWEHRLASGRTLWDELTWRYCRGVVAVRDWQDAWRSLEGIDLGRYAETRAFLGIQEREARWWRDASVLYFQTFAKRPIAADACGAPARTLDEYRINSRP